MRLQVSVSFLPLHTSQDSRNIHLHDPAPDIHLPLHVDVLKGLLAEPVLSQGLVTSRDGTVRRTGREYPVDTRLTHLVVAFGVDEKLHIRIQVSRRLADRADLLERQS